jgi:hypothetical protein
MHKKKLEGLTQKPNIRLKAFLLDINIRVILTNTEQVYVYMYIDICLRFHSFFFFRFLLDMHNFMWLQAFIDKVEQFSRLLIL